MQQKFECVSVPIIVFLFNRILYFSKFTQGFIPFFFFPFVKRLYYYSNQRRTPSNIYHRAFLRITKKFHHRCLIGSSILFCHYQCYYFYHRKSSTNPRIFLRKWIQSKFQKRCNMQSRSRPKLWNISGRKRSQLNGFC